MDSTPVTMDNEIAKMLQGKDLATVFDLPVRNHVTWEGIPYKGLYAVVMSELFFAGKCKSPKDLCFGEYDGIPFFSAIYQSTQGINGIVITASPKKGVCRMGYGVFIDGRVSPVKSSGDIPWETVPKPFEAVGKRLKMLTDKALQSRHLDASVQALEKATSRTVELEIALEKSQKAEAKANLRLSALKKGKGEKASK